MSDLGQPIPYGSDLSRVLNKDAVPSLSSGFADRVIARTEGRAEPLPAARNKGALAPWTRARRVTAGAIVAGALATTAAATGVLEQLPVSLPSAEEVWASITGGESREARQVLPQPQSSAAVERRVTIEGPIDTSEELEEAFNRIDRVRETRTETRRSNVDQRISRAIDRRREQGLPAPNAQQEELLRGMIEQRRELRDARLDELSEERREALRQRFEAGEELTREVLVPPAMRQDNEGRVIRDRLRQLRNLPPEQRRAVVRRWRERQQQQVDGSSADPLAEGSAANEAQQDADQSTAEIQESDSNPE